MDNSKEPADRIRSSINQLYVLGLSEDDIVKLTGLKKSTVCKWTHDERIKRNEAVKRLIESINLPES